MEDIWVEQLTEALLWYLIWRMLARNKTSIFSHVQFLIRQFSYDGTISRFNRLSIHNKIFSAENNSYSLLNFLDKLL